MGGKVPSLSVRALSVLSPPSPSSPQAQRAECRCKEAWWSMGKTGGGWARGDEEGGAEEGGEGGAGEDVEGAGAGPDWTAAWAAAAKVEAGGWRKGRRREGDRESKEPAEATRTGVAFSGEY